MEVFLTVGAHWHCVHTGIDNRLSICTYIGTWRTFTTRYACLLIILTVTSKALTCYKNYSTRIAALIVTELTFPTSTLLSQSHGFTLDLGSNVNRERCCNASPLVLARACGRASRVCVINICTCVCQSHERA